MSLNDQNIKNTILIDSLNKFIIPLPGYGALNDI